MSDLELIVYQEDDSTPYFAVGTSAVHASPYLHVPSEFAEAEIDPKEGTARIGRINVRVVDPQSGATQSERFLTALLGNAAGFSEINGRRALLWDPASGVVVQDGICAGATLSQSYAGFSLALEDIRARGIMLPAFRRTGTATVFPRGVLNGYGLHPNGGWFIPPTEPAAGTFEKGVGGQRGMVVLDSRGDPEDRQPKLTEAMARVVTPVYTEDVGYQHLRDLTVLWRPESGGAWTELEKMRWDGEFGLWRYGHLFITSLKAFATSVADRTQIGASLDAVVLVGAASSDVPTNGQRVEVAVRYDGPASEDYPFHYEGDWGVFARNLLRGDYSADENGVSVDPGLRYDEVLLTDPDGPFGFPIRIRQTETVEDLREYFEDLCRAIGAAPALNAVGKISPILSDLPDADVGLAQLDDTNCVAIPGWEHPISGAVTRVQVEYPRDYRVPAEDDPEGTVGAGDGIKSLPQPVTVDPDPVLYPVLSAVMGHQVHKVDAFCFRALGGTQGEPTTGDVVDEAGFLYAHQMGDALIDRFGFGGQTSFVRAMRSDSAVNEIQVGDWVIDARSWAPNYATGERGRNHLAQVVSVRDLNSAWREMRLVDAAPYANPIGQPTLGAPTADAAGVVSVPVSALPAGGEARVDYAISPTLPLHSSGLWTYLGRTASTGTLTSPPLPAGVTVWIRARGEAVGRRPSTWTVPVSVEAPATPRILRGSVRIVDGEAIVTWTPNAHTEGMRIYYEAHAAGADPVTPLTGSYLDVDASVGTATLASALTGAVTVEFEPWSGWGGSAVTGTPGLRLRKSSEGTAGNLNAGPPVIRTGSVRGGTPGTWRPVVWILDDPDATLLDVWFDTAADDGNETWVGGGLHETGYWYGPEIPIGPGRQWRVAAMVRWSTDGGLSVRAFSETWEIFEPSDPEVLGLYVNWLKTYKARIAVSVEGDTERVYLKASLSGFPTAADCKASGTLVTVPSGFENKAWSSAIEDTQYVAPGQTLYVGALPQGYADLNGHRQEGDLSTFQIQRTDVKAQGTVTPSTTYDGYVDVVYVGETIETRGFRYAVTTSATPPLASTGTLAAGGTYTWNTIPDGIQGYYRGTVSNAALTDDPEITYYLHYWWYDTAAGSGTPGSSGTIPFRGLEPNVLRQAVQYAGDTSFGGYLHDGSFEADINRDGSADAWIRDYVGETVLQPYHAYSLTTAAAWLKHGETAQLIQGSTQPPGGSVALAAVLASQEFEVRPGTKLFVHGWIKDVDSLGTGPAIYVYWFTQDDAPFNYGDENSITDVGPGSVVTGGWTECSSIVTVPAGAAYARLLLWVPNGTTPARRYAFDAFRVDEYSGQEGMERVNSLWKSEGVLKETAGVSDGTNTFQVPKGTTRISAQDGDVILFPVNYQNAPRAIISGGLTSQPDLAAWTGGYSASARVYNDAGLENVTASGATVRAQIRQKASAATNYSELFPTGILDAVGEWEAVDVVNAPAADDQYRVSFSLTQSATLEGAITVALDSSSDGGSTWVERAAVVHTGQSGTATFAYNFPAVIVPGLDATDRFRVRIKAVSLTQGAGQWTVNGGTVQYSAYSIATASKTPDADDFVEIDLTII